MIMIVPYIKKYESEDKTEHCMMSKQSAFNSLLEVREIGGVVYE